MHLLNILIEAYHTLLGLFASSVFWTAVQQNEDIATQQLYFLEAWYIFGIYCGIVILWFFPVTVLKILMLKCCHHFSLPIVIKLCSGEDVLIGLS